ncbi:bifunctional 3-demethylubiquinone-9 3-methyltransferase/ 2-octaprenyl-6-hydroxy phenol methylase [Serratia ficaria]|uniref:methyltransferase domain-containing protein n=1 Tax=Serratia ficaria TaxID=61651 RepID=UPI0021840A34|nr:methyltransferase domain-containing protein [Serratia ficaria]CAI2401201.1 bifunctional 3-demethylubiquinone-9 3-methyltransferase/ 2-octaprenyl-6-hydroxy phenol methylase [Serratia ficaria]
MSTKLRDLVSALPEVYQTIYGHAEWDLDASRDCNKRLDIITQQYDALAKALGRPLRVLDLGCAQGFFSLSLASKGAIVHGIDFQPENIDVCQALAQEHSDFSVDFSIGRVEEVIKDLQPNQYDLAIGLSVFHHIVHLHGIAQVKQWLEHLANCTQAVILELALKEEPLYWGASQPEDPRELIEQCGFYHQLASFDTHLSAIARPLFIVSNHRVMLDGFNKRFEYWDNRPYPDAGFAHKGSRRYYYGDNFICKLFHFTTTHGQLTHEESQRNRDELSNEVKFLSRPPKGFKTPKLLLQGVTDAESWLVMERFPGELLSECIRQGKAIDPEVIFPALLKQLVALEKVGFYHDDVRTWNILVDDKSTRLIDFGSISSEAKDCSWPDNVFLSFMILVNEVINVEQIQAGLIRPAAISPFNLPTPYCNWLYAFWQKPVLEWSYQLLSQLFEQKDALPAAETSLSGNEKWIGAQEKMLMLGQSRLMAVENHAHNAYQRVEQLEQQLAERLDELAAQVSQLEGKAVANEEALRTIGERIDTPPQVDTSIGESELKQQLEHMQARMQQLEHENHHLHLQIDALYSSRSWRMTKPYRYLGLQIKLLRQYGLIQRCRHLAKRILRVSFNFVRRHPGLKNKIINGLYKVGLYERISRVYRRVNPVEQPHAHVNVAAQVQIEQQLIRPELLPPEVDNIFKEITKNK